MKRLLFVLLMGIISIIFGQEFRKGDHELLLMPTAYTMPQGTSYFTDYELVFLNYTYGVTNTTHVGAFIMFPFTSDFIESFSIGGKQQLYSNEKTAVALWGSYTFNSSTFMGGGVMSLGTDKTNFHIGLGTIASDDIDGELLYMLGLKMHSSQKFAFILEYTNMQSGFEHDFGGLFTLGCRFISETICWDFGGMRPLEDTGDLVLFPWLKATVFFE